MKSKIIAILCFLALFQILLVAQVRIESIEYLKGDDFVELYLKTNQMLPTPALFYPIEDNFSFIVMRISDAEVLFDKENYSFDSPIIERVSIKKNTGYVDVEMTLKTKVEHRVLTKQDGIYVRFPVVKEVKGTKNIINPQPAAAPKETISIFNADATGNNDLQSIQMIKENNGVTFLVKVPTGIHYEVIPINKEPFRLAIDLKNIQASKLNKNISLLNIKTIRGAYNSADVYRLVFDLNYLNQHRVTLKDNTLVVEFADTLAQNQPSSLPVTPAPALTASSLNNPEKEVVANEKESISSPAPSPDPDKTKGEFFTEEKSKTSQEELTKTEPEKTPEVEKSPTTYLIQTIDEGERQYSGEPVSFTFYDSDLRDVLLFFAKMASLSIVIDPGVSGKVTCEMYEIPWDQALQYFLKINKLDMIQDGRLLRVGRIDDLAREADSVRKLKEAKEMEEDLTLATRPLSYIKAEELVNLLKSQLSQRGRIEISARNNTLIISETPDRIKVIDKLIDTLDIPNPQVSIEARIVETNSNYARNLGIQWGYNFIADAKHGNQTILQFPNSVSLTGSKIFNMQNPGLPGNLGGYAVNLPASGFNSGTALSLGNVANTFNLDVALTAMENKGTGRIISTPKTTTQNNMEAHIMQGRQIPVQQSINNTITVRMIPAALELKVTPQITAKGTIMANIDIQNNSADFGNLVNGIPPILTQSVKTTVMINDGGTIVIGGIFRVEDSTSSDSVPFLSDIPIIGKLFKNSSKRGEQKELLIFITPRILK